jgi:hypothetical protein
MPIERLITATVSGRSQARSSALLQAAWITISEPAATAIGINSHLMLPSLAAQSNPKACKARWCVEPQFELDQFASCL